MLPNYDHFYHRLSTLSDVMQEKCVRLLERVVDSTAISSSSSSRCGYGNLSLGSGSFEPPVQRLATQIRSVVL